MFQNIKVDVIYYKTNTDFEMEFNLCGCCRMRLLTDKAPDTKTLIHSLSRAVSRSKIIIVIGPLFGENNTVEIVSKAIGSKLSVVKNSTYGIESQEEIEIINGSTPLVTPQGYFGGCIIESGPQTLIALSDSKSIRKAIMNTLVHPYIEDLCAIELQEKAASVSNSAKESAETDEAIEENEDFENLDAPFVFESISLPSENVSVSPEPDTEINEQQNTESEEFNLNGDTEVSKETEETVVPQELKEDISETTEEKAEEITLNNIVLNTLDSEENDIPMSSAEEKEDKKEEIESTEEKVSNDDVIDISSFKTHFNNAEDSDDEIDRDFPDFSQKEDQKIPSHYRRSRMLNLSILILSALLLLFLAVLCYFIFYLPAKDGIDSSEYIREIFNTLF